MDLIVLKKLVSEKGYSSKMFFQWWTEVTQIIKNLMDWSALN